MNDLLFPSIVSTVATVAVVAVSFIAFAYHRRRAKAYARLEENLPDACRYADLQARVAEYETRLSEMGQALAEASSVVAEKEHAQRWLDENRQMLLDVEAQRAQQQVAAAQLESLQQQNAVEYERQQEIARDIEASQVRLEGLRAQQQEALESLQRHQEELRGVKEDLGVLSEQRSHLKSEMVGLESQLVAINRQINEAQEGLQRRLHAIQEEVNQARAARDREAERLELEIEQIREDQDRAVADYRREIERLEFEIDEKKEELKELRKSQEQAAAEIGQLAVQKRGLQEECESYKAKLPALREEWQSMIAKTGKDVSNRTAELWEPVFRPGDYTDAPELTEEECLRQLTSDLETRGLLFPPRVLLAFHTSLKNANISPLVVLAGISGTGKSELPRRYAESMGMHFLNMAVQPRWDSPQDMFGFFNYLESRYRATELGRALVQFDRFHNTADFGWDPPEDWEENSLEKQMLIVLLDEMNLARVEYYFSEFLSRLEIRRGIDRRVPAEASADDLKKASIGLEIGSGDTGSPTMQLFVDCNVLFVGTMNEDETTQTLSDKVVDRANVLRFGRPAGLRLPPTNGAPQVNYGRLSYDTWLGWCRRENDLSGDVSDQIDGWIARLNDAMDHVMKPFAFRTTLAIRSYVANYPERGEEAVRAAMADQIEQKILPKFRGLDTNEAAFNTAISEVLRLLDELGDSALIGTIEDAQKHYQFLWFGVDRSTT